MVVLLMHNIPQTGVKLGGWWFSHGGDEQRYFRVARSIANFDLVKDELTTLGFPLFLTPFVYFSGANEIKDILKPVFIIHAFIFYSISIILVGLIAEKISKNKLIGSFCAGLFTFYPYLFYFLFRRDPPFYELGEFQFLNWLQVIADPLSAFLALLYFYLFFSEIDKKNPRNSVLILIGLIGGFAAMVKVIHILLVFVIVLGWFLKKRIKEATLVAISAAFAFLPQLIYNLTFFGSPFYFAMIPAIRSEYGELFSFSKWVWMFNKIYFYRPIVICLLPFFIIFFALGIIYLKKKDKISTLVLTLWFLVPLIFYGSFSPGPIQLRYFIPSMPPLFLISVSSLFFIYFSLVQKFFKKE